MEHFLPKLALTGLVLFLAGCSTYSLDQGSVSEYRAIAPQTLTVPFKPVYRSRLAEALRLQPESAGLPEVRLGSPEDDSPRNTRYDLDGNGALSLGGKYNVPTVLLSIFSVGIIPGYQTFEYDHSLSFKWRGETLHTSRKPFLFREYVSIAPTAYLVPGAKADVSEALQKGYQATVPAHNAEIAELLDAERDYVRANVNLRDPDSVSAYLDNRKLNLMTPGMIHQLVSLAPPDDPRPFHRKYLARHDHYASLLETEDLAWLIGPAELSGYEIQRALASREQTTEDVIEAMADQWLEHRNHQYQKLTDEHREVLLAEGLPPSIVERMNPSDPDYERAERRVLEAQRRKQVQLAVEKELRDYKRQQKAERRHQAAQKVRSLVIKDNSGSFMSPYTSDGVTAEWVNQAINADIGATAGSAVGGVAGAYAANKVLESVPFGSLLGGVVGSKVGESVGRETAIQASGGWDHIRATSDMSFRSLSDMARYLRAVYGNEPTYNDVITATEQVYPEFAEY